MKEIGEHKSRREKTALLAVVVGVQRRVRMGEKGELLRPYILHPLQVR